MRINDMIIVPAAADMYKPAPAANPIAATAQMLAAVVRPRTAFLRKMMVPAGFLGTFFGLVAAASDVENACNHSYFPH